MKYFTRYAIAGFCILMLAGSSLVAQDLSSELTRVGVANVRNYVNPLFDGFAADLNSGFYHSADLHDVLGFDIGVKVGLMRVSDAQKTFDFVTPAFINMKDPSNPALTVQLQAGTDYDAVIPGAPTAVGSKDANLYVKIKNNPAHPQYYSAYHALHSDDVLFQLPAGFDAPFVPLPMPQAAIGLPFGLEIIGRFIPTVSAGNEGKFNYMGFGVRYSIDQWIPHCPLDIAVHFMTQKMNFKSKADADIFSASGTAFGAEASKSLLFLTLYGGFQIEKASFSLSEIDGNITLPDGSVTALTIPAQSFTGSNKSRVTLGVRFLLAIVNIHADYSFATTPVATAGVGISFR